MADEIQFDGQLVDAVPLGAISGWLSSPETSDVGLVTTETETETFVYDASRQMVKRTRVVVRTVTKADDAEVSA